MTNDTHQPTTVGATARRLRSQLTPLYGEGEAQAMTRLIFEHLKGWGTIELLINEDKPLSPYIIEQIDGIQARLIAGEPIQYITGIAPFYGLDFHVEPGVLIPRPETEELVRMIVEQNPESDLRVLDAGTGSGCIAIALARYLRFAEITALDFSEKALEIATDNAKRLKVRNVKFTHADIFEWQPEPDSLNIIVSNPPYIDESEKESMERNVLEHEPYEALFVPDSDPMRFYRRIADIGLRGLREKGCIYFEINPRHAKEMVAMMQTLGYVDVQIHQDIHRSSRFLTAMRPTAFQHKYHP